MLHSVVFSERGVVGPTGPMSWPKARVEYRSRRSGCIIGESWCWAWWNGRLLSVLGLSFIVMGVSYLIIWD